MTSLVIFGDTHIRSTSTRNAARLASWDQIVREGEALPHLGAWIHLGDVFDAKSTPDDRNQVAMRLQHMGESAPTLIVQGNHCAPGDLDILAELKARYPIQVVTRPRVVSLLLATGGRAAIAVIPYPYKSGLIAQGVAHQDMGAAAAEAFDKICWQLVLDLDEAQSRNYPRLLVGHGTLAGCRTSAGQPMGIDGDVAIMNSQLAAFGDIPKIFGHIHLPQAIMGAHYAGSIAANDWSETEPKRWIEVAYSLTGPFAIISHALDTPALYHVDGELTRDGFTWGMKDKDGVDTGCESLPGFDFTGAEVRVRFRFIAADKGLLDFESVKAPFAGAKRLDLEPIAEHTRAQRAPEVAAAQTLEDKIHAYAANAGVAWSETLTDKLGRLQAPDAAEKL